MTGLDEFFKKHSLANILTICIVVRIFGDFFYLQVGKVFYEFIDYLPIIIACMFGWKANLVALIAPVCSNIYKTINGQPYNELTVILAIVLANLFVDYLATKPFFKSDMKKLLLFEIGAMAVGSFIYCGQLLAGISATTPFSHFYSAYNFVFFMVMLILINAKQNNDQV